MTIEDRALPAPIASHAGSLPAQEDDSSLLDQLEKRARRNIQAAARISRIIREHMQEGLHYTCSLEGYRFARPVLLDAGVSFFIELMRLTPRHHVESSLREIAPVLDAGGNVVGHARLIQYVVRTELVSTAEDGSERVVAEGLGSASTFEPRYLYRWVPAADLPPGVDASRLQSRRRRTRDGEIIEYRVINPDLDGLDNTVLKQAAKRSEADAVRQLPGVQEAISLPPDDGQPAPEPPVPTRSIPQPQPPSGGERAPSASSAHPASPAPRAGREAAPRRASPGDPELNAQRRLIEVAKETDPRSSWYITIAHLLSLPSPERGYGAIEAEWLSKGHTWQEALAVIQAVHASQDPGPQQGAGPEQRPHQGR